MAGGQVRFTAAQGADSALYFSSQAAAILSPQPASPVSLASGQSVSYTFQSSAAGIYRVISQAPEDPQPPGLDRGESGPALVVQPGRGMSFPGGEQPPGS